MFYIVYFKLPHRSVQQGIAIQNAMQAKRGDIPAGKRRGKLGDVGREKPAANMFRP